MNIVPFRKRALVGDVGEVGFRFDSQITTEGYKSKFKPSFYDL